MGRVATRVPPAPLFVDWVVWFCEVLRAPQERCYCSSCQETLTGLLYALTG